MLTINVYLRGTCHTRIPLKLFVPIHQTTKASKYDGFSERPLNNYMQPNKQVISNVFAIWLILQWSSYHCYNPNIYSTNHAAEYILQRSY